MIRPLIMAIQLLTRLPVKLKVHNDDEWGRIAGQSVLYYPVVGLLIGLLLFAVSELLAFTAINENRLLVAALVLSVWVLVSGVLHLDGLADSADAWLGGFGDPDKTLRIMKDPYCGPAGVVAIVLILLLKLTALSSVQLQNNGLLILIPVLARAAVIALFMFTPYVRKGGMGEQAVACMNKTLAAVILIVIAFLTALLPGSTGLILIVILSALVFVLRKIMISRIQGTTGDTAGALIEISETTALLVLSAVAV